MIRSIRSDDDLYRHFTSKRNSKNMKTATYNLLNARESKKLIPTVTAHSGCENTPDNSIGSVLKAFDSGADIFEIDIRFDENGVPVLSHDAPKGGEVKLDEVFYKMSERKDMLCNLDIKATDGLKAVLLCAKKYDLLDRIFYTGITEAFVESVKKETPEISYYLNTDVASPEDHSSEYISSLVDKVKNSGAIGLNCYFRNVTEKLIEAFHESGLLVSVWTVNEETDMIRMMKMKPDNITTRKPMLLRNKIIRRK